MQAVTSHCSSFVAVPETWDGVAARAGDAAAQEGSAAGWQMLNVMLWPTVPPTALWALPGFTWILPSLGDTSKRLNLPWVQAIPSPSLSLARHIHFSPCLLWSIFLLGWPLLQLLLPAPQAAVGRCCTVGSPQGPHRTASSLVQTRRVPSMITALVSAQVPVSIWAQCCKVRITLKKKKKSIYFSLCILYDSH